MTACMSRYGHVNTNTTATERRAKAINANYHKRFKKLDEVFASDLVVGDGTTGIIGPFEAAQGLFLTGQVIPLVVGAFGDVNEVVEKVLKQVAKAAAAVNRRTHNFAIDQHIQKGRSFSNHEPAIQTSHRMCDSKRTSQTHTRTATLCERRV